jgi:hypothetical protein
VGDPEKATIRCFPSQGEERTFTVQGEPSSPFEAELEEWKQEMPAYWGDKVSEADHRRIMSRVELPDQRPLFGSIHLDPLGYLWVERGPTGEGIDDPLQYQIFGPGGESLGMLQIPKVRVLDVGGDYLIGLHTDELDVESVRLFRIARGGEG